MKGEGKNIKGRHLIVMNGEMPGVFLRETFLAIICSYQSQMLVQNLTKEFEKMIFIGYSNQDRYEIVEPIVFHLKIMVLRSGTISMICF